MEKILLADDFFVRQKFVTNSSSTAFVGYGLILDGTLFLKENTYDSHQELLDLIWNQVEKELAEFEHLGGYMGSFEGDPDILIYIKGSENYGDDYGFMVVKDVDLPEESLAELNMFLNKMRLQRYGDNIGWVFGSSVERHGIIK